MTQKKPQRSKDKEVNYIDLIPENELNEPIKELSEDIQKLKSISLCNSDNKEVVSASERLILTLTDQLEYLKDKLKNFIEKESSDY
ncbi:hypothetical protein Bhyg_08407 [Pseudolycoriella hygida]|uniref:Uncharacterized protein n=1 Tax=Pseudolycoriella hygida TaxID=35572 RepID=A0A9Q0N5X2_9DIPT|nr:hypothetical protein Bhyg_08407 [Pseudolycoriella hygida]